MFSGRSRCLAATRLGLLALLALGWRVGAANPPTPAVPTDWFVGKFTGGPFGKNARQLDLLCGSPSACRLAMPPVVLGQVAAEPADVAAANRALAHARRVFAGNRAFFEEKYKQDLAVLLPLLEGDTRAVGCVDVGSIRNLFFFCSTSDDPGARRGGIMLGATLEPASEAVCNNRLYCEHYLVPVARQ